MSTNGGDWKTPAIRQRVIFNIDEAIKKSSGTERRSAQEIEQCIFEKATSRETYMTIVARIILALTAVSQNKGQPIQPTNAGAIMDPNVQPSSMVNPDALRSDTTHILPKILVQPSPINSVSTPSPKILRSPSPAAAQPGKQIKTGRAPQVSSSAACTYPSPSPIIPSPSPTAHSPAPASSPQLASSSASAGATLC